MCPYVVPWNEKHTLCCIYMIAIRKLFISVPSLFDLYCMYVCFRLIKTCGWKVKDVVLNKGNNKITDLRTIYVTCWFLYISNFSMSTLLHWSIVVYGVLIIGFELIHNKMRTITYNLCIIPFDRISTTPYCVGWVAEPIL